MNAIRLSALVMLFTACTSLACLAADPSNNYWYSVTVSKVDTTAIFTGSSDLSPEMFASRVAGEAPVLLENLRIEGLAPGDDVAKWHAVAENPNVYLMPRVVLYFQQLRGDPLIERRQAAQTTFRSVR
jgi:hypothetical protein